ncbi:MAG TPA: cell division protein FtsA [Clostridiaceae bacterium]
MAEYIYGIDIGSSKICIAVGKIDKFGFLQIAGVTSAKTNGVKDGVIVDIEGVIEALIDCKNKIFKQLNLNMKGAYISISSNLCDIVWNKGVVAISSSNREISFSDKERVLKSARVIDLPIGKEIIGVIPEVYIIDGNNSVKEPIGMTGNRLEVDGKVIYTDSNFINNLFKCFDGAGVSIYGLVYQSVALSQVLIKPREKDLNVSIVDVGANTINISMIKGKTLMTNYSIKIGGEIITKDIAICLKKDMNQSENLKRAYSSKQEISRINEAETFEADYNYLGNIMEARIEEILLLILEKLKASGYYEELSLVILTGGGLSYFNNIDEFGKSILKLPVRLGYPEFIGASELVYSTAVGVVMDVNNNIDSSFTKNNFSDLEKSKNSNAIDINRDQKESKTSFANKIKEFFIDIF